MKTLLLTGSSGLLGSNINFVLAGSYDIHGVYKTTPNPEVRYQYKADLSDESQTRQIVSKIGPDYVVHCAALTNVDLCESDPRLARASNVRVTENILSALKPQTRYIYISTDSVFDGEKGNYTENDTPNPINNYARTKLEGEALVEKYLKNYVIIRTNIFGWNRVRGESFAEWVYNSLSGKRSINMFTDVIFNPVNVTTLASYIDKLLNMSYCGRINIGSTEPISKYSFGIKMAEHFSFEKSLISPVSIDTFSGKAKRPKITNLDLGKVLSIFGDMPNIDKEMEEFCNARLHGCEKNKDR